jgi:endonuclease-3
MTIEDRYRHIWSGFAVKYAQAQTELNYSNPFELLVAVILSAQCTDKRVNMVTPRLFSAFPTPEAMAAATPEQLLEYIHSVSYPNSKAKHLVEMSRKLVTDFEGKIPDDVDKLQTLPGVGRKTLNIIAASYLQPTGYAGRYACVRVSDDWD